MNRYKILITLENGNRVDAKAIGENQADALERLIATEQFQQFAAGSPIVKTDIRFSGKAVPVSPDNYLLQESKERSGWWVVTDTKNNIVIQFEEHRFNETAHITPLYDLPREPVGTATLLREIGEYLALYHKELL